MEEDFRIMDLKVTANCCEGCRKQVKKALMSIDGVREITIHASIPRVTVAATVTSKADVQTLIKKLAKLHKMAEEWPSGEKDKLGNVSCAGIGGSKSETAAGADDGNKIRKENNLGNEESEEKDAKANDQKENCTTNIPGIEHEAGSSSTVVHTQNNSVIANPMVAMPQFHEIEANYPAYPQYSFGDQYSYEIPVLHHPSDQQRPQSPILHEEYYCSDDDHESPMICSLM